MACLGSRGRGSVQRRSSYIALELVEELEVKSYQLCRSSDMGHQSGRVKLESLNHDVGGSLYTWSKAAGTTCRYTFEITLGTTNLRVKITLETTNSREKLCLEDSVHDTSTKPYLLNYHAT